MQGTNSGYRAISLRVYVSACSVQVGVRKLNSVGASAYGQSLPGVGGKKKIVVLRTAGAILGECGHTHTHT